MGKVLNNGYIELVESMGGDKAVIRNARRCWRSESKGEESDRKLIRHLIKQGHRTPFESCVFTFDVKAPLFVARQWFRHRIGSYNEESLRYCIAERDFWVPNKFPGQGSMVIYMRTCNDALEHYKFLVEDGMSKEQARAVLPIGIYTKYYWTVNGSSLMNFLSLRLDRHAQAEIRVYAKEILNLVHEVAPICFREFAEIKLNGDNYGWLYE